RQKNPRPIPCAHMKIITPQLAPTLDEFVELAKRGNVVPVFAEFIADGETPVSAFKKLDLGGYSFLFESTEKNDVSGRFSFVGVNPRGVLQTYGSEVRIVEDGNERRLEMSSDPLDEVRTLMARYQFVSRPELPPFAGGAVGFIGYEAIHFFEPKVPLAQRDELQLPGALFMVPCALLVFDHRLRSFKIVVNAFVEDGPPDKLYARTAETIEAIIAQLSRSTDLPLVQAADCEANVQVGPVRCADRTPQRGVSTRCNFHPNEFKRAVNRAKEYIRAGDVFQV